MRKPKSSEPVRPSRSRSRVADRLFTEVAAILEEARQQTVRSVNTYMVTAYWLVGWRIVEAEQGGKSRAGYGERLMESLSGRLTRRYGRGHSVANLRNFRGFYLAYPDRLGEIRYPLGSEWPAAGEPMKIQYPARGESQAQGTGRKGPRRAGEIHDREVADDGDNPTLGLILCTDKNDVVVRYVLDKDTEKIFASRYRMALPSEADLAAEVRREMLALGSGVAPPTALPPVRPERQRAPRSKGTRKKKS